MSTSTKNDSPSDSLESTRPDALATAAGCWLEGAFDLAEVSVLTGLSETDFGALTSDQTFITRVNRIRATPSFGPFLARLMAKRAIKTAVERLEDILADPDASASAITKATELLYSVSQMRSEDAYPEPRARTVPFTVRIRFGDRVTTIGPSETDESSEIEELP
jgi:hypothetical protein